MDITLILKGNVAEKLLAEAERQNIEPAQLAQEAIEIYLDELDDEIEDTPDEKVLADLRAALEDVKAGRTRPARDVLAEIRQELVEEADDN